MVSRVEIYYYNYTSKTVKIKHFALQMAILALNLNNLMEKIEDCEQSKGLSDPGFLETGCLWFFEKRVGNFKLMTAVKLIIFRHICDPV